MMEKNTQPPARPTPLFKERTQTDVPSLPPPGKTLSLYVFTPESKGAGYQVTLPDYRAVSFFTEALWVKDPVTGAYQPTDDLTDTVNKKTEFTPPPGTKVESAEEGLPEKMESTLIFLNDGQTLLTWLNAAAVQEILEEAQAKALQTVERMARSTGETAAKAMASDTITKPFMFPAIRLDAPEKKKKVTLRDYNDLLSVTEIGWGKNEDGTYSPKTHYAPNLHPGIKIPAGVDLPSTFIELRNGDAFMCREEKQDFEIAIDLCHSECAATMATFLRNISYGANQGLQPQPKPQESPQSSPRARTLEA